MHGVGCGHAYVNGRWVIVDSYRRSQPTDPRPTPPGQTESPGETPTGHSPKAHRHGLPPRQAKKTHPHGTPPGQVEKTHTHAPDCGHVLVKGKWVSAKPGFKPRGKPAKPKPGK